jgi:Acyclic terpene utilisation family protein AtuA
LLGPAVCPPKGFRRPESPSTRREAGEPVIIANCSGFYGDRLAAAKEMVEGGPIDFLTGDYLAELTMLILWKSRQSGRAGYARTFLTQMEQVLGTCLDQGIKVVVNAGGLDPAGLAAQVRKLGQQLGLTPQVAHLEGDDVLPQLPSLQAAGHPLRHADSGVPLADLEAEVVTANAYLGAWGIVDALDEGADIVVCPRVTDASLVVGPAAWWFGWSRDQWDALAGAVAAGHVIECGTQASGGNYAHFTQVANMEHPGFPLAEVRADGSAVITKHPGTGGEVSVGTVTAQLLYEIAGPWYANPDVVSDFSSIELRQLERDRVLVSGTRGQPAPPDLKVALNYIGGYRNTASFVLTGMDIDAKAELVVSGLFGEVGGQESFARVEIDRIGRPVPDASTSNDAVSLLRITVFDRDEARVGRAFSGAAVELGLSSYPGFFMTAPPGPATVAGVYWPAFVPADAVTAVVVHADGRRTPVADPPRSAALPQAPASKAVADDAPTMECVRVPLGTVVGARSGDKGGNANVGLWAASPEAFAWLERTLSVECFASLLPEAEGCPIERFAFPHLRALNFVVAGLLGEGVAATSRFDAQAKGLGEFLRARVMDIPRSLVVGAAEPLGETA